MGDQVQQAHQPETRLRLRPVADRLQHYSVCRLTHFLWCKGAGPDFTRSRTPEKTSTSSELGGSFAFNALWENAILV